MTRNLPQAPKTRTTRLCVMPWPCHAYRAVCVQTVYWFQIEMFRGKWYEFEKYAHVMWRASKIAELFQCFFIWESEKICSLSHELPTAPVTLWRSRSLPSHRWLTVVPELVLPSCEGASWVTLHRCIWIAKYRSFEARYTLNWSHRKCLIRKRKVYVKFYMSFWKFSCFS